MLSLEAAGKDKVSVEDLLSHKGEGVQAVRGSNSVGGEPSDITLCHGQCFVMSDLFLVNGVNNISSKYVKLAKNDKKLTENMSFHFSC